MMARVLMYMVKQNTMQGKEMNMHPVDSSVFMTIMTIGFYLISVFGKIGDITHTIIGSITIQGAAGVMAILAAASTLILNLYRFYNDYKKNNENKKE